MDYMNYVGVYGICLDCPASLSGVKQLAALINGSLNANPGHTKVFVRIKVDLKKAERAIADPAAAATDLYTDSWRQWNDLHSLLQPSRKVTVALELGGDLPNDDEQNRWGGEPLRLLMLPMSSFLANDKGYPVLPKGYQRFISLLMDRTANSLSFVMQGYPSVMTVKEHAMYLEHVISGMKEEIPRVVRNTEDYIQHPLQPLRDNLESATYEVFEKDPVKYETYRKAILLAIEDKKVKKPLDELVILVVGAGRGPLVTASVYGAEDAHTNVTIYVVEKNVNALPSLNLMKQTLWDKSLNVKVQIFHTDMRNFVAERKADILVSELLGSFSDNELSPECLDGVYRSVHPDAISIPQEYTSHLCPVMSSKLVYEVMALDGPEQRTKLLEGNYVVNMKNVFLPCLSKPLFRFEHTNLTLAPEQRDNRRFKSLTFNSTLDYVCHGFAGYFDTVLYKYYKLSIIPQTYSGGMFSWFPIFFPLLNPIPVAAGQDLTVDFWRNVSPTQVWYEFAVSEPVCRPIQNPGGRSHSIGL